MNTFYRFFRCAMMLAIMFPVTLCGQITPTTDTNGNNQIDDNEKILYLIQTNQFESFYMIPKDDNVSTANIPNADMLWYFLDAGVVSDTQYYYIINNSTEKCIYNYNGNDRGINLTVLNNLTDAEKEKCKFKLVEDNSNGTVGFYNIDVKADQTYYGLNKQSGSVNISNPVRLTNTQYIHEYNSKWKFIPYNGAFTWPEPPFTPSTTVQRYRFKIKNIVNGSYFISSDTSTPKNATITSTASDNMLWYFLEVGDSDPWIKYFYIVNTETEEYMYYKGTSTDGSNQSNAIVLKDKTSENEDRFQFIIVQTARTINDVPIDGCYTIIPKLLKEQYWNSNCISPTSIADGNKLGIRNGRGAADNNSHWTFEEVYMVEAPTITNNYDGTISLSTTTTGATIYYTTNGNTPDNTSTEYSAPFSLGDATVIKAIAYLGLDFSAVTTYNVPKCSKPAISFDNSTSKVTITSEGTVYYNTGDGSQADPTPASGTLYSEPFSVSSGTTVKAIATRPGCLISDVATKYIQGDDYSHNYLTFNVLTSGTIAWNSIGSVAKEIFYRINGGSWTSITSGSDVTINVNADDVVEFKGNNQTYATDKSNYSGFDGGTASFIISGNIMSLIYGDNFVDKTTMEGTYNFCSLFKQSKAVSAENLILPALTLTADCYRAMFSLCETLRNAPALPATTLATECYWYMFECCAITKAPDLLATNLVSKCYGHMFVGCSNLNYIKCLATSGINNTNLEKWVGKKNAETTLGVAATGVFIKDENASWSSVTGTSGIPTGWDLIAAPSISCDGEYITITCATEGASIYYRLNQTGDFSLYSSPIAFNSTTTVEAYSSKDDHTSYTVIITFEKYDNPFDESNRSLDSWTYGGTQVTLPYSVNGIDGHSANYAKGTFAFETTIALYKEQPTYLWFQHADQSADIYVDDEFVTTHWGGYNAFFVDISNYVHVGTNRIKVILNNTTRNTLAPAAGDFNFNATLGNVKLFTSPYLPSMDYGYDGFHITSTVSSASATINVKTTIPTGATVVCTINGENCNYTATESSTGSEMTFTTTITNPRLWNGTIDPYLYNIKLDIYKDNELYHSYERPYGLRFYEYVIDETVNGNSYTGFLLNGQPYLLRGVCMHHDIEGKANALTDSDIANDFAIIQELGCNFIRLAHYPHPKEVYDWCDQLGIIVQTEVPCVNKMQSTMPADYYTHLEGQYTDMVNQHYNHPCIIFWGLSNETTTNDKDFAKEKIEGYASLIKSLDPSRWVGYVMSHGIDNPSGYYNDPSGVDWFGCNIYVGWYIDQNSNNPTGRLNTRLNNTLARLNKPLAFSEYGGGGTQHCHSDDFMSTTTRGNNPRHDIEYQMWLHEGHIAAIKSKPELLFTSQWQLFDIAVSSRREGYTISLDGENTYEDDNLKYLNNKGLVERDHRTKKDPFYLYKAWWNQEDKFVHICGKDYEKLTGRAIKCYTNDGDELTLFVNNEEIETVSVENNIATFTARNFNPGDVIRVDGATTDDTFTFTDYSEEYVFTTNGNWNKATNWTPTGPGAAHNVTINASCTIPATYTAQANNITIGENGSLTIADGGQLVSNSAVNATVEKNITAYTVSQNQGEEFTNGWYFIASPITDDYTPTGSMVENTYDLYRLNNTTWENYKQSGDHYHFNLESGRGYLYANSEDITLQFTGTLKPYAASESVNVSTGWNLIGNPFAYNVYANRAFYKMNDDKTGIEAVSAFSTSPIAPCTGIVVETETDGDVIFSKEAPAQSQGSNGSLQIALKKANARNNALLDNAIVSFNEDGQLGKFYFGTQNANIYIPQNGKEYAIAFSNCQDDIPLNFKTAETGIYTISFEGEEMCLNSIYLIDMLTGQEIDLSFNPSYTFLGSAADRSERFKIVFKTGFENAPSDIFAYQNGNDIVVSGEGELQIFDVMGRLVSTHHISGVERFNVKTQGVYIFKLNDKTQKIVIR